MQNASYPFTHPKDQHQRWADIRHHDSEPTNHESRLMQVIGEALNNNIFYTKDMFEYVSRSLGDYFLPEEDPLHKRVEHGIRGMEIFYARKAVKAMRRETADIEAAKALHQGQRFRHIFYGRSCFSTVIVTHIDPVGYVQLELIKRGSRYHYTGSIGAADLIERARQGRELQAL